MMGPTYKKTTAAQPNPGTQRVGHEDTPYATKISFKHIIAEPPAVMTGNDNNFGESGLDKFLLVFLAIILPPLAVGLEEGFGNVVFLNIILLLLGWLPAVIHAMYIVYK